MGIRKFELVVRTNSLGMKYMMLRGKWIKPCVDEEHQLKTTSCLKIIFSRGGEGGYLKIFTPVGKLKICTPKYQPANPTLELIPTWSHKYSNSNT